MDRRLSFLTAEIEWFELWLDVRLTSYFKQDENTTFPSPPIIGNNLVEHGVTLTRECYQDTVEEHQLNTPERLMMMLAMMPYLKPNALDLLFTKNKNTDRPFSEFGGVAGKTFGGFIPTLETALFIIAGDNIELRLKTLKSIGPDNVLFKNQFLELKTDDVDEPESTARLRVSENVLRNIIGFRSSLAALGRDFPAKLITTRIHHDDLIVSEEIRDELSLITTWATNAKLLKSCNGIGKYIMPGYRCLFWGPPGTGKTLAAGLLGRTLNTDVYRIDLSMVVSKWIGETEKNLSTLFDEAERHGWILFFDEADALFSRRSASGSSNDRYSNQQVSYLLQRMETFTGVAILATNLRTNLDEALLRRIQLYLHFPMPTVSQRQALWSKMLGSLNHETVDIYKLAEEFDLSGGVIANVVQYALLSSIGNDRKDIVVNDLRAGISRELSKEGRSI